MNEHVLTGKTVQVLFQMPGAPRAGRYWKTMTESEVDDRFHSEAWIDHGVSTVMVDDVFQMITHHYVTVTGHIEVWYVTIHPAF